MIIELSDAFADLTSAELSKYAVAIDHLLKAHSNGWHVLTPGRKIAERIQLEKQLSPRDELVFKAHIANKISVLAGQARSAYRTLLCVPDQYRGGTFAINQIMVPLSAFNDMEQCLPSRLMTENSDADGKYILLLANILGRDFGSNLPLKVNLTHGGGGTTATEYARVFEDTRPTLCVIDSDRKYPGGPLGSTARAVQKVGIANARNTALTIILEHREIENTIPISFLLEVYSGDLSTRGRVSSYCRFLESFHGNVGNFNVLDYIDMKEGERVCDIAKIPATHKEPFMSLALSTHPNVTKKTDFDDLKDEGEAVYGISEKLLKAVVEFIEKHPSKRKLLRQKVLSSPAYASLSAILEIVIAFGAAGQRIPIPIS